MRVLFFALILSCLLSIVLGYFHILFFKKTRLGQPILKYVKEHKDKSGTPTSGGLFFILSSVIIFGFLSDFSGKIATVSVSYGLAFLIIGFIDDFLKLKRADNQGLRPYQKIIFQVIISIFAGVFAYKNGLTFFYIPFTKNHIDFGYFTVPFVAIVLIAVTNSVNLTDGLDGLAGNVSLAYIVFLAVLIALEKEFYFSTYFLSEEYLSIEILCFTLAGALLGFLIFNTHKASVFMGDTGSLSLGGFIATISLFSGNGLFIPIIGFMFLISSLTVIIQVVYFKRTKQRVFLMAPLHHHFQMKGYSEAKISFCYLLITCILGIISIISYL